MNDNDNTQPTNMDDDNRTRRSSPNLPKIDSAEDYGETRATPSRKLSRHGTPPAPPPQSRYAPSGQPPAQRSRQMPPTQQPAPYRGSSPKHGRARSRRNSGFYLPLWSLVLMFIIVLGIAGGIIFAIINMRGEDAPEPAPVVILSTAVPTQRPQSFPASPATATLPPEVDTLQSPVAPLVLSGPTLATAVISPTPRPIAIGETVIVSDVGVQELNVRDSAGVIDTTIIFRAPEGTQFTVVDGPRQGDGLTWWQIQDPFDPNRRGWAASNYLIPQALTESPDG